MRSFSTSILQIFNMTVNMFENLCTCPLNFLLSNLGMNLKKAQERKLNEKKDDKQVMDVASILARRIAVELSDSDDDYGSDDDDSGWSTNS